jgi:hypothetical protein
VVERTKRCRERRERLKTVAEDVGLELDVALIFGLFPNEKLYIMHSFNYFTQR